MPLGLHKLKQGDKQFRHKWLLKSERLSSTEMSILVTAIRSGNLEVVKEKFSRPGSQVNTPIQHGRSPLHIAVQAQKLDVMKYLVGKGADVNLADEDECSPLYYAVLNENKNLVEYLLQMGADPDGEDPEGNKLMDTVKDEAIKKMLKNA